MTPIIDYIILARMSSGRLSGKMLMPLEGEPLLWYPVYSLLEYTERKRVTVATSEESSDDPIAEYCESLGVRCFRGSLHNVAERFRDCILELDCDYAVRVCGDNIFVSHQILDEFTNVMETDAYDFVSNTPNRTFPSGMSFEAVRKEVYLKYFPSFRKEKGDLEHVMPYFYRLENLNTYYLENTIYPKLSGFQLSVNTNEDKEQIEEMLKGIETNHYSVSLKTLYDLYEKTRKN